MQRLWWLNLVRGIVALLIGLLILVWPQSTRHFFVNFLAIYWLSSGLVDSQGGLSTHQKKGVWLVSDLFGIFVGVALLFRSVYVQAFSPELALNILGLIVLFSGLIHIFWSYTATAGAHEQSVSIYYLGMFETVLGILLIFLIALEPLGKLFVGGWMLLGGTLLILQALQIRKTRTSPC